MARPRQHGERVVTAIRVPVDLHARLVEISEERDITINGLMVKATQHYIDHVMPPLPTHLSTNPKEHHAPDPHPPAHG
jgi:hypothetical protein